VGTCAFCRGQTEERLITYTTEYKGRIVVVTGVPAEVCTQCGEKVYRPEVVERLQKIVWGEAQPPTPIEAEFYRFADVA
jgi:YgiT-type zinc finger domain-containing protein